MKLNYEVKMPEEIKQPVVDEKEENRKRLMTRSSMQATVLGAMQTPAGGAAPAGGAPTSKKGWGSVK